MPDQPPKPENVPSYEDVRNALGDDLMSFMSEMLSEPKNSEETDKKTPSELSPREQQLIDYLEKDEGRKLTQQEINLALRQAREIGHL
jgi:hypothetical protein